MISFTFLIYSIWNVWKVERVEKGRGRTWNFLYLIIYINDIININIILAHHYKKEFYKGDVCKSIKS